MESKNSKYRVKAETATATLTAVSESWPELIARGDIAKISGGAYSSRTMANLDCLGKGPKGAFRLGKKVLYPKQALLDWLLSRLTISR
jgi:hypothetical protein